MKKTLIFLSFAASILVFSCSRAEMEMPEARTGEGTGIAINLGVKSADIIRSKADATRPGDDDGDYNENKILTLDYFIYTKDPSANTSTEALTQGRISYESAIEPTTEATAKENARVVSLEEFEDDFGSGKANKCYVYVIANLPASFTMGENGLVYTNADESTTVIGTTWADLQAVEVVADFKGSVDEDGAFLPQDSFVMTGLSDEIEVSGTGADDVVVQLSRLASKITLNVNVIKLIDQYVYNTVLQDFDYEGTYFPNVAKMQIYMTYADSTGVLSAKPDTYDNTFFTYERYAYQTTEIDADGSFAEKVLARDDEGHIILDDQGNPTYTIGTEFPAFAVDGTPFYSYPIEWDSHDSHAPFIKIIIPWVKYDVHENIRLIEHGGYTTINKETGSISYNPSNTNYQALLGILSKMPKDTTLNGQTISRITTDYYMTNRFGDESYYKISIPALKEESTSESELVHNNWYNIKLDISVLGSETDDAAVIISGSTMGIYVCNWSRPQDDLGGDLDNGRYLSTAEEEYTINAANKITIPVVSSHTLDASIVSAQRWRNGDWENVSRGTVTPSGTNMITFENVLNNTVGSSLDCFPFKFVVEISQVNSDGTTTGTLYERIIINQYPSIYVDGIPGGKVFVDGYYGNVNGNYHNYNAGGNVATGYVYTPYAPLTRTVSATDQTDMTVISISSLAGKTFRLREYSGNNYTDNDYSYILADPRESAGYGANSLIAYYNGSGTTNWTAALAGPIKRSITTDKRFIAPRFMISSRWGRMSNWQPGNMSDDDRFETVQKRCATYQEAGYPAGRWRLPTPAEIAFIGNLQRYDLIDDLFTAQGYSISSTGDVFTVSGNNVNVNQNRGTSCRCVYDLWYWGDDPAVDPNTYSIKPE